VKRTWSSEKKSAHSITEKGSCETSLAGSIFDPQKQA
jgi:hypothetical protein